MGPITVVKSGSNVQSAAATDVLMSSKIPYTKLDTQNIVSFQTISLLFDHEPTQPTAAQEIAQTPLYQFPHGYSYIPSIWFTWENSEPLYPPSPVAPGDATYTFFQFGDETSNENILGITTSLSILGYTEYYDSSNGVGTYTNAFLYTTVDETNVYISIQKTALQLTSSNTAVPIYVAGITVNMRCYVFTEPSTTTSY